MRDVQYSFNVLTVQALCTRAEHSIFAAPL